MSYGIVWLSLLLPVMRWLLAATGVSAEVCPPRSVGVAGFLAPVLICFRWHELTAASVVVAATAGMFGCAFNHTVPLFFVLSVEPCSVWAWDVVGEPP